LNGSVEEESVQWHFESLGNSAPEGVAGDTSVSREADCQLPLRR
jgi:hypothetical protein